MTNFRTLITTALLTASLCLTATAQDESVLDYLGESGARDAARAGGGGIDSHLEDLGLRLRDAQTEYENAQAGTDEQEKERTRYQRDDIAEQWLREAAETLRDVPFPGGGSVGDLYLPGTSQAFQDAYRAEQAADAASDAVQNEAAKGFGPDGADTDLLRDLDREARRSAREAEEARRELREDDTERERQARERLYGAARVVPEGMNADNLRKAIEVASANQVRFSQNVARAAATLTRDPSSDNWRELRRAQTVYNMGRQSLGSLRGQLALEQRKGSGCCDGRRGKRMGAEGGMKYGGDK